MMHADLNHLLTHPGLVHALRRSNANADLLMALITDGPSGFMTLHFAALKLQKLYFRKEKEWGFKPTSGVEVTKMVWMCMETCKSGIERALGEATVGAIDGNSWPVVALSTRFDPQFRPMKPVSDLYVPPKRNGHLRLVVSKNVEA
ncbi:hypothetical protein [Devosia sp. A449]